jgi:hypothetical protein
MIKTKYTEIIVCDICDVEIPEQITCGICARDVCCYHRSPSSMENRPEWYPLFTYLCSICCWQPQMVGIVEKVKEINELVSIIHRNVIEDTMGIIQKEGEE